MPAEGREKEIPRYVIVLDFQHFVLYDLEPETQRYLSLFAGRRYEATDFALAELRKHIPTFAFHGSKRRPRHAELLHVLTAVSGKLLGFRLCAEEFCFCLQ